MFNSVESISFVEIDVQYSQFFTRLQVSLGFIVCSALHCSVFGCVARKGTSCANRTKPHLQALLR
eukprot:m.116717 g.116717  ORF g.116717 m.116717 type:complete len:65 (+) comp51955_c0_seq6:1199-1393(+)